MAPTGPPERLAAARQGALNLLGHRSRTRREVERYLERHGLEPDEVEQILGELNAWGYLDDAAIAAAQLDRSGAGRPLGARRIAASLRGRGIPQETIESVLSVRDPSEESALASRTADEWVRRHGRPVLPADQRRLADHLCRRGFEWEVAAAAVNRVLDGASAD